MSTGQNIVDEVRAQLNDEDTNNLRWTDTEMLRFVNAGQRQIVMFVPEANIIEATFSVTADSDARQTIPADGVKFIKITANDDTGNTQRGPAITQIDIDAIDSSFPDWMYTATIWPRTETLNDVHSDSVNFEHYMHDPREPKIFYLYPAPDLSTTHSVFLVYAQLPTDLSALSNTFALDDEYQNAMVEYVQYRALSKDGRYGAGADLRRDLWNNFRQALGLKIEGDARVGPGSSQPPAGP